MNVVLFDESLARQNLLPFTFTRPVCEIRLGIFTIRQKWENFLDLTVSYLTQDYLSKKFPLIEQGETVFINGKICPSQELVEAIKRLKHLQALVSGELLVAFNGSKEQLNLQSTLDKIEFGGPLSQVNQVWEIFQHCGEAIKADLEWINTQRKSQPLSNTVTVIGDKSQVFLEAGAQVEACILNTKSGPIYIGRDAEVMEGSAIRGPFALGEHSTLKLNTKIYGATSVGPHCKVGGEVSNSVIFGYSNKGHDGFLGNAVLGEWCNLGADTNNSNLKNNYASVRLYNYGQKKQVDTGLQFCGLMMGDHSKSGINTMFNTGTVVGVGANIYGGGFPPTYIPGFSWGGSQGFETYRLDKMFETAEKVFERRDLKFDQVEKEILEFLFKHSS